MRYTTGKKTEINTFTAVLMLIIVFFLGLLIYSGMKYAEVKANYEFFKKWLPTYKMYEHIKHGTFGITGVYFNKEYYCIWVGNRTEKEINRTEAHELCHHYVTMDYGHFCKWEAYK